MPRPQGRAEVARRRQQLDATFAKIDGAGLSAELTAHYSRYLCVLVSGFAEQSIKELVAQYCRQRSSSQIQRFAGKQMARFRNIDLEKLKQVLESFDTAWWLSLSERRPDELSALGSVATVRNGVSHGSDSGITLATIKQYYTQISVIMEDLCDLLDPSAHRGRSDLLT